MKLVLFALLASIAACAAPDEDVVLDEILTAEPVVPSYSSDLDTAMALYCPGISHAAGVTTYRGFAGTYQRLGLPAVAEPYRLKIITTQDEPVVIGSYAGTRGGPTGALVAYAGALRAIGDNPAIGAAMTLDTDGDGELDQTWFVLGIRRSLGKVTAFCLAGVDRPFLMNRSLF